tara:strand:- start:516 stop:806 length:291 start_codon:yes stop_codon:yes gene_type:complete
MNRYINIIYFISLISLPIILIFIPANFFDSGQSICLSVFIFDKECYGCGMTRAILHLIHFDFIDAYNYNKLSFFVLPLSIYLYLQEITKVYKKTLN